MGTDSKTVIQQPSSKVSIVSSKTKKPKKSKNNHKPKHNKQQRSSSSSSQSSNEHGRNSTSTKKSTNDSSGKQTKLSSTVELRNSDKKSSNNNKKQSNRLKHGSSESPHRRNNNNTTTRSRSRSRTDRSSRSRSSDRSQSRDSPSRYRHQNSFHRSGLNMQNVYAPMPNFMPNMTRRYLPPSGQHPRGGRMPPYIPRGMMGGGTIRDKNRRSDDNSPSQSLLGGYRPSQGNFRGRGGSMNNAAYLNNVHNMANMIQNMSDIIQQQQKGGVNPNQHKYPNPNNPHNRFYQQFQDNYKKLKSGEKISKLYQASFPVQHIPREMRFNFRLLGRNIFTASDEEEEQQQEQKKSSDKRSKQRRDTSSESEKNSEDDRRKEEEEATNAAIAAGKSKSSPILKNSSTEQKRSSAKTNRNRTSAQHSKSASDSHELLTNTNDLSTLLAGIIQSENPQMMANTLVNAAAAAQNKRERTRKKEQRFKNYARFQQSQTTGTGTTSTNNSEEAEQKIRGLARRLQMKTIGLHEDYKLQGMKRSDDSSVDSNASGHRHGSSSSDSEHLKNSDAGTNSQRQHKLKKSNKKMNTSGQLIDSSDSEHDISNAHRSDVNDSDGSMMNFNEDLKPIGYYMKDRERMLHEMFRCVRGHKLQAILPDGLKTRSLDEIKSKCLDQLDILSKKRIRAILLAQSMTSSSGTEDSTEEDEQDIFTLYPQLKSSFDTGNNNATIVTTVSPANTSQKSVPNSKFRPVQMHDVTENIPPSSTSPPISATVRNSLSAPVVVGGDEDVNDYYEGFKKIKKLTNLRRNQQDEDLTPFPDQSGKLLHSIGTNLPKFEFKPITGLTHSQKAHLNALRAAHRQQNDIRQEIDDLIHIDDFVLPTSQRPLSSAELSINEQRRYGLPPRLHHTGPPKKGSLGDLLKQEKTTSGERSPSPMMDKRRQRSYSLSSVGSDQCSRSSSISRHSSFEKLADIEDDMSDLSKLLDLNEEDELLLLQIEVEQEERHIRRDEKRKRKEEKKKKKSRKMDSNDGLIIQQCLNDLIEKIHLKRTFDSVDNHQNSVKKIRMEEKI